LPSSRYIRQEIFEPIGAEGQRRISAASAVIVGCGALGTNIANNLARSGVGRLRLVDRDVVELDNLQRQVLFDEDHVRRRMPKAAAAVERLRLVNSAIVLEAVVAEVSPANIVALLAGADVVMDGTDNVEARLLLNDACLKHRVPCVFAGAVGATGMVLAMVPGRTPCYRCLMAEIPAPGTVPTAATAGILHSTTAVVAALQCTSALRLLTGAAQPGDEMLSVDVWEQEFARLRVPRRAECPACGLGRYEFLTARPARQAQGRPGGRARAVPGTGAVWLPAMAEVELSRLAEAWRAVGQVVANEWLVSLTAGEQEVVVFADGRCLVKGAGDAAAAVELAERHLLLA